MFVRKVGKMGEKEIQSEREKKESVYVFKIGKVREKEERR